VRATILESRGELAAAGVDLELALESARESAEAAAVLPALVGLAGFLRRRGRSDDSAAALDEVVSALDAAESVGDIQQRLDQLDLRSLFTGEHDDSACIVQINAKDGGVDAQDFAQMLLRMYARWAERKGFEIELNYEMEGAEAGINAAEFTLTLSAPARSKV